MRDANPLDHVHFYDDLDSPEKRKLRPGQISAMVAGAFEDTRVRVYCRRADPTHCAAVHEAFEGWVRRRFGGAVETSTPSKPRGGGGGGGGGRPEGGPMTAPAAGKRSLFGAPPSAARGGAPPPQRPRV
jgi:hypothetical protein